MPYHTLFSIAGFSPLTRVTLYLTDQTPFRRGVWRSVANYPIVDPYRVLFKQQRNKGVTRASDPMPSHRKTPTRGVTPILQPRSKLFIHATLL